jgi:uncharacterized protein YggT (Ycf19 family)
MILSLRVLVLQFSIFFLKILCEFIFSSQVLFKVYRALCYTTIVFEQMVVFNPNKWPLALIRRLVKPYFKFWSTFLPPAKLEGGSYDVSVLVALETINTLIETSGPIRYFILSYLQDIISELDQLILMYS